MLSFYMCDSADAKKQSAGRGREPQTAFFKRTDLHRVGWRIGGAAFGLSVLSVLANALSEQVFDLSVERTEVLFCPRGQCIIQRFGETQGDLLFRGVSHGACRVGYALVRKP